MEISAQHVKELREKTGAGMMDCKKALTEANGDFEEAKKSMERWYWWGIPTFFRCPWNEDPGACDIALVGVPHSSGNGSTERDQHLGPRAIRHVSALYRRSHGRFAITPWRMCRINDLGDVPLPEAMVNDVSVVHIEANGAEDIEQAFDLIVKERADAVDVLQSAVLFGIRGRIAELGLKHRLPIIGGEKVARKRRTTSS